MEPLFGRLLTLPKYISLELKVTGNDEHSHLQPYDTVTILVTSILMTLRIMTSLIMPSLIMASRIITSLIMTSLTMTSLINTIIITLNTGEISYN